MTEAAQAPPPQQEPPRRARQRRPPRRGWRHTRLLLAILIGLAGAVNLLLGLGILGAGGNRSPLAPLDETLTEGLTALGRSAQTGIGGALVIAAVGLALGLRSAWAFSILLLAVLLVANLAKRETGETLLLGGPIAGLLAWLVIARRQFLRSEMGSSLLLALVSGAAVLAYGTLGAFLLGAGFQPRVEDVPTAFYLAVVTLTTVGFGDIVPVTTETRMFTVSVIVLGLVVFATTVASTFGTVISSNLRRVLDPQGVRMDLSDHVILVGTGLVAENTARELLQRRIPHVRIIPQLPGGVQPAGRDSEHLVVGDATEDQVLEQAGIGGARLVVAASDDETENAMITLAAKDLNPAVRVLALAETPAHIPRLKRARADLVFAPAAVGGRLLATLVEGREIEREFRDLLTGEL